MIKNIYYIDKIWCWDLEIFRAHIYKWSEPHKKNSIHLAVKMETLNIREKAVWYNKKHANQVIDFLPLLSPTILTSLKEQNCVYVGKLG